MVQELRIDEFARHGEVVIRRIVQTPYGRKRRCQAHINNTSRRDIVNIAIRLQLKRCRTSRTPSTIRAISSSLAISAGASAIVSPPTRTTMFSSAKAIRIAS